MSKAAIFRFVMLVTSGLIGGQQAMAAVACPKGFIVSFVSTSIPAAFQGVAPNSSLFSFNAGQVTPGFESFKATGGSIIASANLSTDVRLVCVHQGGSSSAAVVLGATMPSGSTSCFPVNGNGFSCTKTGASPVSITCPKFEIIADAPGFTGEKVSVTGVPQTFVQGAARPLQCRYEPARVGARVTKQNPLGAGFVAQGGTFFSRAEANQNNGGGQGNGGQGMTVEAEGMAHSTGGSTQGGWNIWSNGNISKGISLAAGKRYRVTVVAKATLARGQGANMSVKFGNQAIGTAVVSSTSYANYNTQFTPSQGQGTLKVEFTNDFTGGGEDRNLFIDKVILTPL